MKQPYSPKQQLIQFLSGFPELNEDVVIQLAESIPVFTPKKGTVLMSEGEVPEACYFILKGLIRQYQLVDGIERTTEFYSENKGTISSSHFTEQTPSSFYLECLEDCLLIGSDLNTEAAHYEQFPELVEITRKMLERDLNEVKMNYSKFILSSPKERYLHFLEERNDLLNRVPLHQIASYLGMTPESLSRIRKRIVSPSE